MTMADVTDLQASVLAVDARRIRKRVPPDVRRVLEENLRILGEFPRLDPGEMPQTRQVQKSRELRNEAYAYVDALLDQFETWEAEQPVDHGPVKKITTPGGPNADGEWIQRIDYQSGDSEEIILDTGSMEARKALEIGWLDAITEADNDRWRAGNYRQAAAQVPEAATADQLRAKAKEYDRKARERRTQVTDEIVADATARGLDAGEVGAVVRSFDLAYNPPRPGVAEALELAKAGKIVELYDHAAANLGPEAKLELFSKLDSDPSLKGVEDKLLEIESDRRGAAARIAQAGGML